MDARSDALDRQYGVGKWHCDDIGANPDTPECVRAFLAHARAPAHGMGLSDRRPLFATWNGARVRVVMASRFGDVGITRNLTADHGYEQRVVLPDLTDFGSEP